MAASRQEKYDIVIIGAGPVATALAGALRLGGVPVLGLWARRPTQARAAGVPMALVNARLSERSAAGYGRVAGIAREAICIALNPADHAAVVAFCKSHAIDLVVVGPEAPLVAGIAALTLEANPRLTWRDLQVSERI